MTNPTNFNSQKHGHVVIIWC